jgi:hypothetical protein
MFGTFENVALLKIMGVSPALTALPRHELAKGIEP